MNETMRLLRRRRSVRSFANRPVSRDSLEQLLEAARWAPSGRNTQPWRFVVVESAKTLKDLAELAPQRGIVASAPVSIVVLRDLDAGYDELKDAQGIGAAIQNILLAAESIGLSACWTGRTRDAAIEQLVGATQNQELMAIIAVGYSDEDPQLPERLSLEEIVRFC